MNNKFELITAMMLDVELQRKYHNNPSKFPDLNIEDSSGSRIGDKESPEWTRCAFCYQPGPDTHPNPDPPSV